jgi:hypothetical protein
VRTKIIGKIHKDKDVGMPPHFNFGQDCREFPASLALTLLFATISSKLLAPRTAHEPDLQQLQFSGGPVPVSQKPPRSLGIV